MSRGSQTGHTRLDARDEDNVPDLVAEHPNSQDPAGNDVDIVTAVAAAGAGKRATATTSLLHRGPGAARVARTKRGAHARHAGRRGADGNDSDDAPDENEAENDATMLRLAKGVAPARPTRKPTPVIVGPSTSPRQGGTARKRARASDDDDDDGGEDRSQENGSRQRVGAVRVETAGRHGENEARSGRSAVTVVAPTTTRRPAERHLRKRPRSQSSERSDTSAVSRGGDDDDDAEDGGRGNGGDSSSAADANDDRNRRRKTPARAKARRQTLAASSSSASESDSGSARPVGARRGAGRPKARRVARHRRAREVERRDLDEFMGEQMLAIDIEADLTGDETPEHLVNLLMEWKRLYVSEVPRNPVERFRHDRTLFGAETDDDDLANAQLKPVYHSIVARIVNLTEALKRHHLIEAQPTAAPGDGTVAAATLDGAAARRVELYTIANKVNEAVGNAFYSILNNGKNHHNGDSRATAELPVELNCWTYVPPESDDMKTLMRLLVGMLQKAREFNFRRMGAKVFEAVYTKKLQYTRHWRPIMSMKDFVYFAICPFEHNMQLVSHLFDRKGNDTAVAEWLVNLQHETRFPILKPDRRIIAFETCILNVKENRTYSFDHPALPASMVAGQYIPLPYHVNRYHRQARRCVCKKRERLRREREEATSAAAAAADADDPAQSEIAPQDEWRYDVHMAPDAPEDEDEDDDPDHWFKPGEDDTWEDLYDKEARFLEQRNVARRTAAATVAGARAKRRRSDEEQVEVGAGGGGGGSGGAMVAGVPLVGARAKRNRGDEDQVEPRSGGGGGAAADADGSRGTENDGDARNQRRRTRGPESADRARRAPTIEDAREDDEDDADERELKGDPRRGGASGGASSGMGLGGGRTDREAVGGAREDRRDANEEAKDNSRRTRRRELNAVADEFVPKLKKLCAGCGEHYMRVRMLSFLKIFQAQRLLGVDVEWILAFMARMFFDVKEMENWQVFFILIGLAATGKSTLMGVLRAFFEQSQIGMFDERVEDRFPLMGVYKAAVILAFDIGRRFNLTQGVLHQVIVGESVEVFLKGKEPVSIPSWKAPMWWCCNVYPKFAASGGAMVRRIVSINFPYRVQKSDPELDKKIAAELPAIIYSCVHAFHSKLRAHKHENIWDVLPQSFQDQNDKTAADGNALESFLRDSARVLLSADGVYPWNDFKKDYRSAARDDGVFDAPLLTDTAFNDSFQRHHIVLQQTGQYFVDGQAFVGPHLLGVGPSIQQVELKRQRLAGTAAAAAAAANTVAQQHYNSTRNHVQSDPPANSRIGGGGGGGGAPRQAVGAQ